MLWGLLYEQIRQQNVIAYNLSVLHPTKMIQEAILQSSTRVTNFGLIPKLYLTCFKFKFDFKMKLGGGRRTIIRSKFQSCLFSQWYMKESYSNRHYCRARFIEQLCLLHKYSNSLSSKSNLNFQYGGLLFEQIRQQNENRL